MMSLKHILSALVCMLALTVLGAGADKAAVQILAGEIAGCLKMKSFDAAAVAAKPAAAFDQLNKLNGKDGRATALSGICMKEGFGTPVSLPGARSRFLAAAKLGDPLGQFWGGFFLIRGIGGAADVQQGVDLLESSAVQGISNAMLVLAHVYLEGYSKNGRLILAEDHPLALRYLRRAAAGGNKEAAMALGDWFFKGGMVKNDPAQAREWFKLAAGLPYSAAAVAEVDYETAAKEDQADALAELKALAAAGNARARVYVGKLLLKQGDAAGATALCEAAMKQNYPPAFTLRGIIAKTAGQRNWIDYMLRGARMGDPEAMAAAGFHQATTARGKLSSEGLDMLERSSRRGVMEGQAKMGRIYLQGRLVPKDEIRAFQLFRSASEKGSTEGKYYLSLCYRNGIGCRVNYENAAQLAMEAAATNDSYAQTLYATYLRDGIGVARNTPAAMSYLEKAAKQGNRHAKELLSDLISKANDIQADSITSGLELVQQSAVDGDVVSAYSLGRMYTDGAKIRRDYALGRKNLELAAKRKYSPAFAALADYYINGWGVKKDIPKALQLLAEGRKLRNGDAVVKQGICKLQGIGVRKDVSAALRDFRQGAQWGSSDGELWLGLCYARGTGVPANAVTAYSHYRRAALMGNSSGLLMLALCYKDGVGVAVNGPAALTYMKKAAEQGNSNAYYELGLLYANGVLVKKDLDAAVKYFKQSAEAGNSYGIYELACCYESGRGVTRDLSKAASLYRISAAAGNRYAQFMIGRCYEGGIGVLQDKYEAVKWYKKAAQGGFKYAAERAKKLQNELENLVL